MAKKTEARDEKLEASVTVRLSAELSAQLDRHVEAARVERGPGVGRADVMREALIRFLKA